MNWQDKVYESLTEDYELEESKILKRALQIGALTVAGLGTHDVTRQTANQPTHAEYTSGQRSTSSKLGRFAKRVSAKVTKATPMPSDKRRPAKEWEAKEKASAEAWKKSPMNPEYKPQTPREADAINRWRSSNRGGK